jgi:hypothetical protein
MLRVMLGLAGTIALFMGVVAVCYVGSLIVLAIASRVFPLVGRKRR